MRAAMMARNWLTAARRSQVLLLSLLSLLSGGVAASRWWSVTVRGDRSSTVSRTAMLGRIAVLMAVRRTAMMVQHR
jgi:hypothetical protein